ncbi:MAG: rhodanese-like domain-containing protein, partial [Gammaproteobacteria bacterium]|nr:rhodanese-like domain-containing protein [Gammaproteobacteria bacterium]
SCDANVRVLDIRNALDGGSKTDYVRGHIPCAVYTDYLTGGWRAKVKDVPGQLAPVDKLEKLIGGLGIDNNTHVVIVHHGKNALDMGSATRLYWTFKVLGHDAVSILDGGYLAYAVVDDKGKPVNQIERGSHAPEAKVFKATLREDMIATKEAVAEKMKKGVTLVDLRPEHQFVGINRHGEAKRYGTIPGARNLPESWLTENGGGKFRSVDQLKQLYELANVPTEGAQVTFCNTGHWASLGWFVGSELLGNKDVMLYDGSMVEWSADSSLPMESKINLK